MLDYFKIKVLLRDKAVTKNLDNLKIDFKVNEIKKGIADGEIAILLQNIMPYENL